MKQTIIILIIVAALGGGAWWYFADDDEHDGSPIAKDASGKYLVADTNAAVQACGGELFDTHIHLDDYSIPDKLATQMESLGVGCAVLFMRIEPDDPGETAELLQESLGGVSQRFIPFMFIDPQTAESQNVDRVQTAFEATNIPWQGLGEVAFYRDPFRTDDLTSDKWDAMFEFAAEHDLVFMLHPRDNQADELRQLLSDHPKTTILFHGPDIGIPAITDILQEYPNVYYTLDTATLVWAPGILGPLQFADNMTPQQFAVLYDTNEDQILDNALVDWIDVLTASPEKIMWGTDVAFDWHADPLVYQRLIQFSKKFIARLPEMVRQPFAMENARTLFGSSVAIPPDQEED